MHSLPFSDCAPGGLDRIQRFLDRRRIAVLIIRKPEKRIFRKRITEAISGIAPDIYDAIFFRPLEHGAEAVEPKTRHHRWRRQMGDRANPARNLVVVICSFAGKAAKDIPEDIKPDLLRPAQ